MQVDSDVGVNPLHFTTKNPLHCDEETLQPLPLSTPTITTYGNFLHRIAALMPALQDRISLAQPNKKYDEVLHFDKLMRDLVTTQMPSCLSSQTPVDPSWPPYVTLARRCLTITSAHKIIVGIYIDVAGRSDFSLIDDPPHVSRDVIQ